MTDAITSLTLDDVKAHIRVDGDYDDWMIQTYTDAAVNEVQRYCGITIDTQAIPADLALAVMEQVAHAYDHRADPEAKPGLTPAAARICARHRRVAL